MVSARRCPSGLAASACPDNANATASPMPYLFIVVLLWLAVLLTVSCVRRVKYDCAHEQLAESDFARARVGACGGEPGALRPQRDVPRRLSEHADLDHARRHLCGMAGRSSCRCGGCMAVSARKDDRPRRARSLHARADLRAHGCDERDDLAGDRDGGRLARIRSLDGIVNGTQV